MWLSADIGTQVAGYGPILVATAGLITALVAGASRRDKAQSDRSSSLDEKTDKALRGLETALDRTEQERSRWELTATRERDRADQAEARVEALEEELRNRPDPPARTSRRPTAR